MIILRPGRFIFEHAAAEVTKRPFAVSVRTFCRNEVATTCHRASLGRHRGPSANAPSWCVCLAATGRARGGVWVAVGAGAFTCWSVSDMVADPSKLQQNPGNNGTELAA